MESFLLFLLPVGAYVGGARALALRLQGSRRGTGDYAGDRKALHSRWSGYSAAAAGDYWGALKKAGDLDAEKAFLKDDLAFPVLYGGAAIWSLIYAISQLGWTGPAYLLLLPVMVTMAADWAENTVQLAQLDRLGDTPEEPDSGAIRWASLATQVKLVCGVAAVLIFALVWIRLGWTHIQP